MATDKQALINKLAELRQVAEDLPGGAAKDAVNATIGKLSASVFSGLLDDGSTQPVLEAELQRRGAPLGPDALQRMMPAPGDGVLACC